MIFTCLQVPTYPIDHLAHNNTQSKTILMAKLQNYNDWMDYEQIVQYKEV